MISRILYRLSGGMALVTYFWTAYLTLIQFGVFWGVVSLTPFGVIAIWFVGTWPLALFGLAIYFLSIVLR